MDADDKKKKITRQEILIRKSNNRSENYVLTQSHLLKGIIIKMLTFDNFFPLQTTIFITQFSVE